MWKDKPNSLLKSPTPLSFSCPEETETIYIHNCLEKGLVEFTISTISIRIYLQKVKKTSIYCICSVWFFSLIAHLQLHVSLQNWGKR